MNLLLILFLMLLVFGSGLLGYNHFGTYGPVGLGGVILIVLIIWLFARGPGSPVL